SRGAASVCAPEHLPRTVLDLIEDCVGCGSRPDLPLLRVTTHQAPGCFIGADYWLTQHIGRQRGASRLQHVSECIELIPKRVCVDEQAVPIHHPHLSLERQLVGVLCDRYAQCEINRVARTGKELLRPLRRFDARTASTSVLLAKMLLQYVLQLDDIDLFARFVLLLPDLECAAAARADLVCLIEKMHLLEFGKQRLLTRTVPGLRCLLGLRLVRA